MYFRNVIIRVENNSRLGEKPKLVSTFKILVSSFSFEPASKRILKGAGSFFL